MLGRILILAALDRVAVLRAVVASGDICFLDDSCVVRIAFTVPALLKILGISAEGNVRGANIMEGAMSLPTGKQNTGNARNHTIRIFGRPSQRNRDTFGGSRGLASRKRALRRLARPCLLLLLG